MKRETYIRLANAILKQSGRERELAKNLQSFFDGNMVSEISTDLQIAVMESMESETNDSNDAKYGSMLRWWLFDAPNAGQNEKTSWVKDKSGEKVLLPDAGSLYDFLMR